MSTFTDLARRRPHADRVLAVAALVVMVLSATAGRDLEHRGWLVVGGVVLSWLPLLVLDRYPFPVLAWVAAVETVHIVVAVHDDRYAAILPAGTMLALYTIATRRPVRVVVWSASLVGALQFAAAALTHFRLGPDLLYLNWALVASALGGLIQERRNRVATAERRAEDAERSRQAEADRQVTAERLRIARELHDVLAHHITVVNAQAGVARYLLHADPAAAETALGGIVTNSRAALDDLRATLGLLRTDDESETRAPVPTADDIRPLLDRFVDAGMPLVVDVHGARAPMTAPAELAFYRVVQEALTNATKHAPGRRVHLDVDWQPGCVQVTITNERAGAPNPDGAGYGLTGMRERASAADGSLDAGPAGSAFRVALTLPTTGAGERPDATTNPTGATTR